MGLNTFVEVTEQYEGWGDVGCNPKGTEEAVSNDISDFVSERIGMRVYVSARKEKNTTGKVTWVFDHRGRDAETTPLVTAMMEWVVNHFSIDAGIDCLICRS